MSNSQMIVVVAGAQGNLGKLVCDSAGAENTKGKR
jgi:hypothetical protein